MTPVIAALRDLAGALALRVLGALDREGKRRDLERREGEARLYG